MQQRTCPVCGEHNAPDAAFCRNCDAYLGWDQEAEGTLPTRAAGPDAPGRAGHGPGGPADAMAEAGPGSTWTASGAARTWDPAATPFAGDEPGAGTELPPQPPLAGPTPCPRCGTDNDPQRRFCGRCGHALVAGAEPPRDGPGDVAPRRPWWRRVRWARTPGVTAAARRAYRRALPMRYRAGRIAALILPVALVAGIFAVTGGNPVGAARRLWYDVRDVTVPVREVRASADGVELPGWEPPFAVDGTAGNAWGVTWAPSGSEARACTDGAGASAGSALVLQWDRPVAVHRILLVAGLRTDHPATAQVARPRELEVRVGSTCRAVALENNDDDQSGDLGGVVANRVRVAVTAVHPPTSSAWPDADPTSADVAITEIAVLSRPR